MTPRKRKLYATLLGLGVIAVASDRLFVLPDEASAERPPQGAVTPPPAGAVVEPAAAPVSAAPKIAPRVTIANRLDQIAERAGLDPDNVRNAFRPPAGWLETDTGPARPEKSPAERFREVHRLNAVMAGGREGYVIIDGRTLYIGQELDGFALVSVRERSAVLVSDRERIELKLPER